MPVGSGAGRLAWGTALWLWRPMHERDRHPGRRALEEDVDPREVLGVIAQLDPPGDEGRVDASSALPSRETVAVLVTLRTTDHRKASARRSGSAWA